MKGVRDKPEISSFLKVGPDGRLLGLETLETQQNQAKADTLSSRALYRHLTYWAIVFTVVMGISLAGILYLDGVGAIAQVSTGVALLMMVLVLPLIFLGYVGYRVLRGKSSPQDWVVQK
ncbi:MAG: hypothetical protein MUC97_06860 [Bernardetiaceae bacterium]|jgi:hypothetical protein|nr:hypothetical protein [Bernardetiaceae bacterium]